MPEWTEEQRQVIDSRGQSLLVSAAAGSGKTAVLVQRILEKILDPESGIDIDRLLVVTFTNAAASSLREKVRARLEDEAAGDDPRRAKNAMRQLSLLAGDHIETIDRFCREIVLDHADALQIDPSFRIADEGELKLLQSETVSRVIEESCGDPDEEFRRAFLDFSSLYAPGRFDEALEDLILRFYDFSMSHEFPRMWRRRCAELYREDADRAEWMEDLSASVRMQLKEIRESLREGLSVCVAPGGPYQYAHAMESHADLLDRLVKCASMAEISDLLNGYSWQKPDSKKRGKAAPPVDAAMEKYVKAVRERAKKGLDSLAERFFFAPEDQVDAMRRSTKRHIDVLVRLTDRFEELFSKEKEARRIADFSDVAHWALRVLICVDEEGLPVSDEEGGYVRTRLAEEYAEYFREIYIDEYQDSNRVQEILLQSIARRGGRFMVGDMKQSIYRFRMADTGIFLEKAKTYSPQPDAAERRIDLHRNFRSRSCVLDAVNLVFSQIMRREIGGVEYTSSEELRPGRTFPTPEAEGAAADPAASGTGPVCEKTAAAAAGLADAGAGTEAAVAGPAGPAPGEGAPGSAEDPFLPELLLVEKDDVPGASGRAEAEAVVVAERILGLVGKMQVFDSEKGFCRPLRYEDITILLRTASVWAETFSRILDEYGIPNRPDASTGYFDAVEVRTILAYLNVLDNPRQDIPLAACLCSLIGDMDDRELSVIRTEMGSGSLYDVVLRYMEKGKDPAIRHKLEHFQKMTLRLRALVRDTPIHVLLWKIFDETCYEDRISATRGGRQKRANLALLVDMAISYEETSYRGLFHFIRYIEKLRKAKRDIGQAADCSGRENLVRIMTMHKSKGLEFPVVFVCGLNKRFNLQDARGSLVLHERLGAGLDYRDQELRGKMENRIRSAIAERVSRDSVGEELRVLYVAMTRAKEKLILTGCVDSRQKAVEKALSCRADSEKKLPASVITGASGMLDWILASLARHSAERDFFDSGRWEGAKFRQTEAGDLPGRFLIRTGTEVLSGIEEKNEEERRHLERLLCAGINEVTDPALHERLESMLSRQYPWPPDREQMPGKLSVSEIKHEGYAAEMERLMAQEEGALPPGDAVRLIVQGKPSVEHAEQLSVPVPEFLKGAKQDMKVSVTDVGSAYHLVLASLDFENDRTLKQIQALLETMLKCDKIQREEAARLDAGRIAHFLESDLGKRMRTAALGGRLWREQPFVIGRRASLIRPEWGDGEQILIQGIIDAFFIEGDQLVLVDYKSDRARPGDEESLVRRYRVQFELYADALRELLGMEVKESWLYSLSLGRAIPVNPGASLPEADLNKGRQKFQQARQLNR